MWQQIAPSAAGAWCQAAGTLGMKCSYPRGWRAGCCRAGASPEPLPCRILGRGAGSLRSEELSPPLWQPRCASAEPSLQPALGLYLCIQTVPQERWGMARAQVQALGEFHLPVIPGGELAHRDGRVLGTMAEITLLTSIASLNNLGY